MHLFFYIGCSRLSTKVIISVSSSTFTNFTTLSSVEPFISDIACTDGYFYTGPCGSGHYLKMVHNGIEYGMMQAIGEGFSVQEVSNYDFDFAAVSKLWNNGPVVRSWLMALLEETFNEHIPK